ncbi:MAG: hypothetical protein ACOZNI_02830 [Myxococcota bacterium]
MPPPDPRDRLARRLPGDRLAREGREIGRLFAREEPPDVPDPVPARDQKQLLQLTLRKTGRVADPHPNAPLLIRIVRYPFRLDGARPGRAAYISHPDPEPRVRVAEEIAGALADRERVRFTSAGRGRPRPFAVRPSTWALLPDTDGDDV